MQMVMAYAEFKRFNNTVFGGFGVELETDVFMLGKKPKNGLGFRGLNKAYVHYFCRRDGPILLEPFPNPTGGSEALHQISGILDNHVGKNCILNSDSSRAIKAWVSDHPHLEISHVIVTHSEAKYHGFTWLLYVDNEDDIFENMKEGEFKILTAGTQFADGFAAVVKKAFNNRGGVRRKDVKAELKEIQFRHNTKKQDIYDAFMEAWGDLEQDLRSEPPVTTIEAVKKLLEWDYEEYENTLDEFPAWTCPGCEYSTETNEWRKERSSHKKSCRYYHLDDTPNKYEHRHSRCICCIYPYHKNGFKIKATRVTLFFIFFTEGFRKFFDQHNARY